MNTMLSAEIIKSKSVFFWAETVIKVFLIVFLFARLAGHIANIFSWQMDGDISYLYYISWLINEHDYFPYRDIHETSFFGTFVFYPWLTRCIGYSITAFYAANLVFFAILSFVSYGLLKSFGRMTALLCILLFGEFYFKAGYGVQMQRDLVALLPVATALWLSQQERLGLALKCFVTGILFAMASCIKPQFAAGLVVVVILIFLQDRNKTQSGFQIAQKIFFWSAAGFLLIWMAGIGWLYIHNALGPFVDMVINYLPHYLSLDGRNAVRSTDTTIAGGLKWFAGMVLAWFVPLCLATCRELHSSSKAANADRQLIAGLLVLWLLYLCYVIMAGKYWTYHILPSYYFLSVLLSLVLVSNRVETSGQKKSLVFLLAWIVFFFVLVIGLPFRQTPNADFSAQRRSELANQELSRYLRQHLVPGDRVQAHVTHTRGPIFPAMLESGAEPATPYLLDHLFYHDIHRPFVKLARQHFLDKLGEHPPRFILVTPTVFFFRGENTEARFEPFENWLEANYRIVFVSSGQEGQKAAEAVTVYEYKGPR